MHHHNEEDAWWNNIPYEIECKGERGILTILLETKLFYNRKY